jgi:stress-induced morphogen
MDGLLEPLRVRQRLRSQCRTDLEASFVQCIDVSGDHSCDGGAKLELIVVSDKFTGVPLLQRHRLVNECLRDDFMPRIHAITMKTWTQAQYESQKQRQN